MHYSKILWHHACGDDLLSNVASNNLLVDSSEAHLSCMKVIGSTKNTVGDIGSGGLFGRRFNGTCPLAGTAFEANCGNLMPMVSAVFVMLTIL